MWPVTQRYLDTLAESHTRLCYVEILQDGVVQTVLQSDTVTDPTTGFSMQTVGGSIAVDRQVIRRSGSVNMVDVSGIALPSEIDDLLVPLITEVRPWVGLQYWDATGQEISDGTATEFVPLATLVVTDIAGTYPQRQVSGYDRMWMMGPFTAAFALPAGTALDQALTLMIQNQLPANRVRTNFRGTEQVSGALTYTEQTMSADSAHEVALAAGQILYVDPMGTFTLGDESSTTDPPIITYAPGQASVMMRPARSVSASNQYNMVVMTTSATDINPPLRSVAVDDNPNSLTYVKRVGSRPLFEANPLMRTQGQLDKAARTRLAGLVGVADTLATPIIPNHALESGDVIHVTDPDQGIDENVVVDAFGLPIRAADGAQTLTCRAQVLR